MAISVISSDDTMHLAGTSLLTDGGRTEARMPIAIAGLRALHATQSITVVSPLIELGSALHVLNRPAHHRAEHWASRIRESMSPHLARQTSAWAWTSQAIRAAPFLRASVAVTDFDTCVGQLRGMPPRQVARQLLRPIARTGDDAVARRWSRSRAAEVMACVEALTDRPAEAVDGFVDFLTESWDQWFGVEWQRIEPALSARARQFDRQTRGDGLATALAAADPSITVTGSGDSVTIAKVQNARHDVARRGLAVAPSHFIRPHLYVANVPGQPMLLIVPVTPDEHPASVQTVAEVTSRLVTVAHLGRLEVARAIATEPRTAGEIATLWNMDPTLVNRHLRSLESAGLARTTRRGRFVQYSLELDAVQALGRDLVLLLLR